jgi:myo-inositol-1(or 4)-monophosphatase
LGRRLPAAAPEQDTVPVVDAAWLLDLFDDVAEAIRERLDALADWGEAPDRPGQYRHDVVADAVAVPMLLDAGLGVLSEESDPHALDRNVVAVIDPIDGSTNASIGLPWFATSICAVDADGPLAALVVNQALDVRYRAVRGEGATRDGSAIAPTTTDRVGDAIVVFNDWPPSKLACRQVRVLGAAALDLCAVADGTVDAFVDYSPGLFAWDHLGGLLVCREAGAHVAALDGADPLRLEHDARTRLVAGATDVLCAALAESAR